jgi:hypothetical protein
MDLGYPVQPMRLPNREPFYKIKGREPLPYAASQVVPVSLVGNHYENS